MSCASAIYACNTNSQAIVAGNITTINFGSVVRRFGRNTNMSGGNVTVNGSGYYNIDTNFVFTAATGTVDIKLLKDGIEIPGATATITTAANTSYQVSIPCIVRSTCCCDSNITAIIKSSGTATVNNAAIEVTKI